MVYLNMMLFGSMCIILRVISRRDGQINPILKHFQLFESVKNVYLFLFFNILFRNEPIVSYPVQTNIGTEIILFHDQFIYLFILNHGCCFRYKNI